MAATSSTSKRARARTRPDSSDSETMESRRNSAAITAIDQTRWFDFRAGISLAELATRENVRVVTIERSIERMRAHVARFSAESAELATRQLFLQRLPDANQVFVDALAATRTTIRKESVLRNDPDTGLPAWIEDEIEVVTPDHKTRLSAVDALQRLLASTQPKQPMVSVDARSQTNYGLPGSGNNQQHALGAGQPAGALSAESIIRQIRIDRGLSVTGASLLTPGDMPTVSADQDFEGMKEFIEDGGVDEASEAAAAAETGAESQVSIASATGESEYAEED